MHDNVTELENKLKLYRTTTPDVDGSWTEVTGSLNFQWSEATDTDPYTQSFTVTGLPKFDGSGKVYTYRMTEETISGYERL